MSLFERELHFIAAASKTEKPPGEDDLLTQAELAFWMRRSDRYISSMKRWGFPMEAGVFEKVERASLRAAFEWLKAHPEFRVNKPPPARLEKKCE